MDLLAYRRTGRTTNMMYEARNDALAGKYVLVVIANEREKDRWYMYLLEQDESKRTNVETGKVYFGDNGGSVSLVTMREALANRLDINFGYMPGIHPSVVLRVDHFVLEGMLGWGLREWLAYNEDW